MENNWRSLATSKPADKELVETKVDDELGERNVQSLKLIGRLWWTSDSSMYVYYTPTHWRPIQPKMVFNPLEHENLK